MGNTTSANDIYPPQLLDTSKEQFSRLQEDQELWGNEQNGTYRGVSYYAKRNLRIKCWCGYIIPNAEISGDMYVRLDELAHRGITGEHQGGPGFDCAHHGDFTLIHGEGIYRNYPYVFNNIKSMIDTLLDE